MPWIMNLLGAAFAFFLPKHMTLIINNRDTDSTVKPESLTQHFLYYSFGISLDSIPSSTKYSGHFPARCTSHQSHVPYGLGEEKTYLSFTTICMIWIFMKLDCRPMPDRKFEQASMDRLVCKSLFPICISN